MKNEYDRLVDVVVVVVDVDVFVDVVVVDDAVVVVVVLGRCLVNVVCVFRNAPSRRCSFVFSNSESERAVWRFLSI